MLSRCLLNGEKNSESATACGLQRSQTRKRTFSLLTAVVAGNTGWEELQGSKLSSCIHFGHWFTRIFYHILLLRPRPCIFGVTSLRMTSLRLMKKVNFQNCHHSNMYNMHKMNLSSGHSITHYSKLIQPNIQSQGNLFFHFGTKYVHRGGVQNSKNVRLELSTNGACWIFQFHLQTLPPALKLSIAR